MRGYASILSTVLALLLVSCAKQDSGTGPHATVFMRDGTQFAGTVTSTSPSDVTLKGDDNVMHTLAMRDVKSIEYDDAAAPPAETAQAGARPARRSLNHERHEHPQESAIRSKTYEVSAGTEIAVRSEETIDSARAAEGQTFAAEVTNDVRDANGDVVIPQGANAQIVIRSSAKGGRFKGTSDLVLGRAKRAWARISGPLNTPVAAAPSAPSSALSPEAERAQPSALAPARVPAHSRRS